MSSHLPSRHSLRLKGYDYSQEGLYFLTICTQDRLCLFGEVHNGEMQLNDAGRMIEKWYYELENKFPDKRCLEMVVMPNHFHCIIENIRNTYDEQTNAHDTFTDAHTGAPLCGRPCDHDQTMDQRQNSYGPVNKRYHASIPDVMDWFKTMTTNEYIREVKNNGWKPFNRKLWQRNYWDRIIFNHEAYANIANYIIDNPAKWGNDTLHI